MITVFGCPVNSDYLEMLLKSAGYDPADESGVVKIVATDDGKVTVHWPSGGTSELVNASSSMTFLSLPDTPDSYSGSETFYVKVNSAGTDLVFVSGGGTETDELVKTSSADSTAGYLGDKIDTDTMAVDTANQTIKVKDGVFASAGHTHSWSDVSKSGSKLSDIEDVPAYQADKVLGVDSSGTTLQWVTNSGGGGTAGATTYLELDDTPSSYSGHAGEVPVVKGDESGLDWFDAASAGHTHTASEITDFDNEVSNNTDVAANTSARHSHSNKTLLDSLISSGSGTEFLADDGSYKAVSTADERVKADSGDPSAGYLSDKVDGATIKVNTASHTIQVVDGIYASAGHTHDDRYYTEIETDNLLSAKADKVSSATSGNFAGLDASGNLTDSGKKASDFAAASHTHTYIEDADGDTGAYAESSSDCDYLSLKAGGKEVVRLEDSYSELRRRMRRWTFYGYQDGSNLLHLLGRFRFGNSWRVGNGLRILLTTVHYNRGQNFAEYILRPGPALEKIYEYGTGAPQLYWKTVTYNSLSDVIELWAKKNNGYFIIAGDIVGYNIGITIADTTGSAFELNTSDSPAADPGGLTEATDVALKVAEGGEITINGSFGSVSGSMTWDTASKTLQLENDSSSPGACMFYGTDESGARGWYSQSIITSGDKGVFGGGYDGSNQINTIDYITISSPGNASDFGDLTVSRYGPAATSNGVNDKGVFGGGYNSNYLNTIDYITISSPGNAQDFGDLTVKRHWLAATSNGTSDRGMFGGGYNGNNLNTIEYLTISSPGNAQDFGDLTVGKVGLAATSNGTNDRGVFGGGSDGNNLNTIDYITISSPGNATDFGDLTIERRGLSATSNGTNNRGVFGGGKYYDGSNDVSINTIDYITISSPGNATDFGDLTISRRYLSATSNGVNNRGVFGGGEPITNLIDYVTISLPGNAQDFGDLTVTKKFLSATSNA